MNAVGALFLIGAGLLAGILGVKSIRLRADRARKLVNLVELIRFEIERFKTPLPALFSELSGRTDGISAELCGRVFLAMQQEDVIFREAWSFACAILTEPERRILLPLGSVLGRYGAGEQTAALDSALSEMRRYSQRLGDGIREETRLWLGLSVACGLMAAVLLW